MVPGYFWLSRVRKTRWRTLSIEAPKENELSSWWYKGEKAQTRGKLKEQRQVLWGVNKREGWADHCRRMLKSIECMLRVTRSPLASP